MGSSKNRWQKITFFRSPPCSDPKIKHPPPKEFICPISQSVMADPVIVSSGQTLERNCVQLCKNLNFTPFLSSNATSKPDFSTVIPNVAIKTTILNWCKTNRVTPPNPIDSNAAEKLVRALMASQNQNVSKTESARRPIHFRVKSEKEPVACSSEEEEKVFLKLKSFQQEEAVIYLRHITRTDQTVRVPLCTARILSSLRSLLISRISVLQVNSIAALVNLSLEMGNKVKIVRSGVVPPLIDILKFGSPESVEYSVSLLFSLSLDDQNKTAIGVLGGLPPLLNLVNSESQRVGHESVLALYHLSLVETNRSKLVKLGAVSTLLSIMKSPGNLADLCNFIFRILYNLTRCAEGRAAMLDANAVKWLVELVKGGELESVVSREKCVEALSGLSCGSLRFRGLAREAGAVEVLSEVVERGNERVKEKAKRMLVLIREGDEKAEIEEVDWESLLLDSGVVTRSQFRFGYGLDSPDGNSA